MKLIRSLILVLSIGSIGFSVSPANALLKNEAEVDLVLGQFMALLQKNKVNDAATLLLQHWPTSSKEQIDSFKSQVDEANKVNLERFGKLMGTETVKSCRVGRFLYKSQAVVKYQRGFVFWNFSYYNAGSGWTVESYRFDNKNFVPLTESCL